MFRDVPKISFKRIVQAIKTPTFLGFALVSASLTLYLYLTSGSSSALEMILLGLTALCLEGLKLYALLTGNIYSDYIKIESRDRSLKIRDLTKSDAVCKSIKRASGGMYLVYALAACISIFGSYNFTLTTIDKTYRANEAVQTSFVSPEQAKLNSQIAFYDKEIRRLQERIDQNTVTWKSYGSDFQTLRDRMQNRIDADIALQTKYENAKAENEADLARLNINAQIKSADVKKTSFQILSENLNALGIHVTAEGIIGGLLILTSLLIELGIIITSPHEDTFGIYKKVAEEQNSSKEKTLDVLEETVKEIEPIPESKKRKYTKKKEILSEEAKQVAMEEAVKSSVEKAASILSQESQIEPTLAIDSVDAFQKLKEDNRVEVRPPNPVYEFLKNILPVNGEPGWVRRENQAKAIELSKIPYLEAKEIFNNLTRVKTKEGNPIFEYRKNAGKWWSSCSLDEVFRIVSKE